MPPKETISYKSARERALQALAIMEKMKVKPLPVSYAVWFSFVGAENKDLVAEVEKAKAGKVNFDEGMNEYLYEKYLNAPQDKTAPSSEEEDAKKILSDILDMMNEFSDSTNSYNSTMDSHIKELSDIDSDAAGKNSGDVSDIAKKILLCAKSLRENSQNMANKLEEAKQETEILRNSLIKATDEAQRDFLTNVFNRKALDKKIDELTARSEEENSPLCLLMIDIDYFKKFNDTHGHIVGDAVLKMVASILKDSIKGKDMVARYGGEEFAILLPDTPIEGAMVVAEIIRKTIAAKELKRRDTDESVGQITVSIGVSQYRAGVDSVPTFIKRADDALYCSKKEGRNRVTKERT